MNRLAAWLIIAATVVPVSATAPPKQTADGFAVPQPGTVFTFPRDHGSHPEFRVEWWYITGHLFADDGQRFGFQATFFRQAGPRLEPSAPAGRSSELFASDQLFLAHMALLDVKTGQFIYQERLARRGWDADAAIDSLHVTNGPWRLSLLPGAEGSIRLSGSIRSEAQLQLTLTPRKPLVVFGENGVSRKAADPTASSHYLTFPRLAAQGVVQRGAQVLRVTGQAWMDHEFSSSQLGADQVGWDWASIQLDDGREIMAYRMRRTDGSSDPYSTLAWIDRDGAVSHVGPDSFTFTARSTWTSPLTRAIYPTRPTLRTRDPLSGEMREFRLEPLADAQELTGAIGGVPYWEGACRVLDEHGRELGSAYLELTGYTGDLRATLQ